MDDCLVALVSQLNSGPASLVEDRLPDVLIDVCLSVHHAPVDKDDRVRLLHLGYVNEDLLEVHLEFHEKFLELDSLNKVHLGGVNEGASFLENGGSLGHLQHSEPHLVEH